MDHTDTGLRAVVKALTDVIGPAVNTTDPLASEQLRLTVDYIEFVRSRIDFLYDRERFDLHHHLDMAKALDEIVDASDFAERIALKNAIEAGMRADAAPGLSIRALKETTAALAAAIAALIRKAQTLNETTRQRIERHVLEASDARIAFERSWYLPLGFDPAPGEVKTLEEFLG